MIQRARSFRDAGLSAYDCNSKKLGLRENDSMKDESDVPGTHDSLNVLSLRS